MYACRHAEPTQQDQLLAQEDRRPSRLPANPVPPLAAGHVTVEASRLEAPPSAQHSASAQVGAKKEEQMLTQEERRPSCLQANRDPLAAGNASVEEASQLDLLPSAQPSASTSRHTETKKKGQMLEQEERRPSRLQAKQDPLAVSEPVEASQLEIPPSAQPSASMHMEAKKEEQMLAREERRPSRLQAVSASAEELETALSAQPSASRLLAQEERRPSHLLAKQDPLSSGNIPVQEDSQLEIPPSAEPSEPTNIEAKKEEQMLAQDERRPSRLQANRDPLAAGNASAEEASQLDLLPSAQSFASRSRHIETKKEEQVQAREERRLPSSQAEQDPLVVGDIPLEVATELETPPRRPSMHAVNLGDETSWKATGAPCRPPQTTLLKMSNNIEMLPEPRNTASTQGFAKGLDALEAQEEGLADTTGLFRSRPNHKNSDQHRGCCDVQPAKASKRQSAKPSTFFLHPKSPKLESCTSETPDSQPYVNM